MLLEILAAAAVAAGEPAPADAVPIMPPPVEPAAIPVLDPVTPMMVVLSFVVDEAGQVSQCQLYSGPIPAGGKPVMQAGPFCPPNFDYPYYDANGRPVARRVSISRTVQVEDAP